MVYCQSTLYFLLEQLSSMGFAENRSGVESHVKGVLWELLRNDMHVEAREAGLGKRRTAQMSKCDADTAETSVGLTRSG